MRTRALTLLLALAALATAPAAAAETLSPPIEQTPRSARGTVILLPGGGWASPSREAQRSVWEHVGPTLLAARYRAVAIDIEAGGAAGLRTVLQRIGAERTRLRRGPLCLYGESSGGHLALLAAQRESGVDCVITFGSPTSFTAFAQAGAAHPEHPGYAWALTNIIQRAFGARPAGWAPWEPARRALRQQLLMMICADDPIVPLNQIEQMPAQTYVPPAGDLDDPADAWVHGSVSAAGRAEVRKRVVRFVNGARWTPVLVASA